MPLRRGVGYNDAYFRTLPFDQQLARTTLKDINPGPDGVASMSKCRYNTDLYEIQGHESLYDAVPSKSTSRKATPSPLLALPEKFRIMIYTYAVTYSEPIPIRMHSATMSPIETLHTNAILKLSWFFVPPLLSTCREIERDATSLFYANNNFQAELTDGDASVLLTWLQTRKTEHSKLIPELIITLEPQSYFDLETLRRTEGSVGRSYDHQALSKLLVFCGLGSDKIVMSGLSYMPELARDARALGRGTRDASDLVSSWFEGLQKWLDFEESSFGKLEDEEGAAGEKDSADGQNHDVGAVTNKMERLMCTVGKERM